MLLLKFGREAETQADELGVEYSSKINYDAKEMADFFLTLKRQSQGESSTLPVFLSTHPDPGDRYKTVGRLAAEWKTKLNLKNPEIRRNDYLRRIEGLVYGQDPRQGYLENNIFYHPLLKLQFPVPKEWNYQNSSQRVQVAAKDGKALMFMSLAKGNTLQEAATATLQGYGLKASESKEITMNGLRALNYLRITCTAATGPGSAYNQLFYPVCRQNFRELTDKAKINKKPLRIRIKTIHSAITLKQALQGFKVPETKMEETAILNGMQLTDLLVAGTLIKVIEE